MLKNNKKNILAFILGIVLAAGISVYAAIELSAIQIGYKDTTVKEALDDLYTKVNNTSSNNKLYLYWNGNTYDEVTGGWDSSVTYNYWSPDSPSSITKKSAVFNNEDGYMQLTTNGTYQYAVVNTINKIDCTKYNYIHIWYDMTNTYRTNVNVESTLTPTYIANAPGRIFTNKLPKNDSNYSITLPINCSEEGYVAFSILKGVASDANTDIKIYGVYLSEER